jgi:hypothetical protein
VSSRPPAGELLKAIGELLEGEVMPAVPEELRHKVRVAANVIQILTREWQLGSAQIASEHAVLRDLIGSEADVSELRRELDRRLKPGSPATADFDVLAWQALVLITRSELAIVKPGHDRWERD